MTNEMPRGFKGIWIPKEIWLHKELSCFEKSLWAEIHSLDHENGCTASNEYLCNFFNIQEKTLQRGLAKLKNLGFVKVEKFNGRIRVLRANVKDIFVTSAPTSSNVKDKFDTPDPTNLTPLTIEPIYNKEDNKDKTTPTPLKGDFGCVSFGHHVKMKQKDYDDLLTSYGKIEVDSILEEINDYLSSTGKRGYKDYAATVRSWLRRRGISHSKAGTTSSSYPSPSVSHSSAANWKWAILVKEKFDKEVEINSEGLLFNSMIGSNPYKFSDHNFREKVLNRLKTMKLPLEGL